MKEGSRKRKQIPYLEVLCHQREETTDIGKVLICSDIPLPYYSV